jgi:hypothetical protein
MRSTGILWQAAQREREKEFRKLPSKELRRLAYRKRAGLHPSERFAASRDSIIALQILSERKKAGKKPC